MVKQAHASLITPEELLAHGKHFKACVISFFDGMLDHHLSLLKYAAGLSQDGASDVLVILCTYDRQRTANSALPGVLLSPDERGQMLLDMGYPHIMHLSVNPDCHTRGNLPLPENSGLLLTHCEVLIPGADTRLAPGFPELFKALEDRAGGHHTRLEMQFLAEKVIAHQVHIDMIYRGYVADFMKSMGYAFPVSGYVVKGNMIGRTLGYPTANLRVADHLKILPAQGVYVGMVKVADRWHRAMINIGIRPTLDINNVTIEAHIFDFDQDIYGEVISVSFLDRIRDEMRFSSLGELKLQLDKDKTRAYEVLAACLDNATANAFVYRDPIRWS